MADCSHLAGGHHLVRPGARARLAPAIHSIYLIAGPATVRRRLLFFLVPRSGTPVGRPQAGHRTFDRHRFRFSYAHHALEWITDAPATNQLASRARLSRI